MSNPTRQEIIDAHDALEDLKNVALNAAYFPSDIELYVSWKTQILAALPPKPQPTMAEVEWDDDKHYLAEAEHVEWGTIIMLRYERGFDRIQIFRTGTPNKFGFVSRASLTPTGKRYALTEVQE